MKNDNPLAPAHLSKEARAWWREVVTAYELAPHHVKLLRCAAESWDRMQEARAALAKHGTTYVDRWKQPRTRPEVQIERDSRTLFMRACRELNLDRATEPVRPPPIHGRYHGRD